MKQLYIDIRNKLAEIATLKHIKLWNGQTAFLENINENKGYSFALPACFIDLKVVNIEQMADKSNRLDIDVELHIVHEFLNNIDTTYGDLENDLQILDLKQSVFSKINGFQPTNATSMMRTSELMDTKHYNVVEYLQTYRTSLVDLSANNESNEMQSTPPTVLTLTVEPK